MSCIPAKKQDHLFIFTCEVNNAHVVRSRIQTEL